MDDTQNNTNRTALPQEESGSASEASAGAGAPEDGGPAFPRPYSSPDSYNYPESYPAQEGLTLRDYFAAKAMQGLLVSMQLFSSQNIADQAYKMADGMLAARGSK